MMNPLFVGIDVGSRNNVAYLMKPDGSKHSSFSVQNNLGGAKLLSERIVSALGSMQLSDVVIGLEATSIYGDSLVYALREDGSLGRFQRKIHVLNPKQVRKFKDAYPDLPKNDWVDAFVIADHLRFGRIAREVYMDDYRYQALRTLTRARFDVIQNLSVWSECNLHRLALFKIGDSGKARSFQRCVRLFPIAADMLRKMRVTSDGDILAARCAEHAEIP